MIPRRLHYCWYGPEKTEQVKACINSWRKFLPNYEIIEWNESNTVLDSSFLKGAFEQKRWTHLSDYVRSRALFEHGGIYLDVDVELIKPLDDLLENRCFLVFQMRRRSDEWVSVATMGSEPGHLFWQECMQRWKKMYQDENIFELGPYTATLLLTRRGLCQYGEQMLGDIKLYPHEYFYPYSRRETFIPQKHIKPQTHGIHYWSPMTKGLRPGRIKYHVRKWLLKLKGYGK